MLVTHVAPETHLVRAVVGGLLEHLIGDLAEEVTALGRVATLLQELGDKGIEVGAESVEVPD